MSQEYHVGDVSTILQSPNKLKEKGKNINRKLQNLFSPTYQGSAVPMADGMIPKAKKQKRKKKELTAKSTADIIAVESQKARNKKRKNKDDQITSETGVEQENVGRVKKKKKSNKPSESYKSSRNQGFSPPVGIIHESLLGEPKKKARKRKSQSASESEDERPFKKRRSEDGASKKKMTRKRRDRQAHSTDHRTIYVGNLPVTVKKKKLMNLLKEYGTIESIRYRCYAPNDPNVSKRLIAIKKNLHPDRNNCVAYVCFESPESAKKALKCNGKTLDGLHLRVDMAARDQVRDIKKSIFVGNLPFDVEEEAIRSHFEDCGTIGNVRIVRDSKTSLGKGFCYVSFTDTDAVAFALRLNDSRLAGRQLRVMQCLPNPRKSSLDKRKDPAGKTKRPIKKGFRPSIQDSQPFQVIEAGKDWKKPTHGTVEEEPKKTKFQEKFEKAKQHRIEAGETFKKVQKRLSEKKISKQKNKEELKINSPPQIKAGSNAAQENNMNKLKKAELSSSQEKKQVNSKHKKAELHGSQENNTKKLKRAGLNSSEEKKQNSNKQKKAESCEAQENVTNKVKRAELNSFQEKKEDSNKQKKSGYHSSLKMKQNADREKKAKLKSLKGKTSGSDIRKGNDKTESENSKHSVADKSSHKSRIFVNKSKFASSRNSDTSATPGSGKFNVPGKAKTFRNKETILGDKFRPLTGAKHSKFDESGKRFERKTGLNHSKTKFPQPPAATGNTSRTGKHIYFD